MWPFRKVKRIYLIKKPITEVFTLFIKVVDKDFKERSSIRGKQVCHDPPKFELYAPSFAYTQPPQIKPFRTDILVVLFEEDGNTRINTIVKSNLIFPLFFFIMLPHMIGYMWTKDMWFDIQTWAIYILGLSMMYFGDRISKSVVLGTFEHYIVKAR